MEVAVRCLFRDYYKKFRIGKNIRTLSLTYPEVPKNPNNAGRNHPFGDGRIWSLWDMLDKYSASFGRILVHLFDAEMALYDMPGDKEAAALISEAEKKHTESFLLPLATNAAKVLALDSVPPLIERISRKLKADYSRAEAYADMGNLRSRIEDQLRERFFYFVTPTYVDYYRERAQFGTNVEVRFSAANDDIEDAGKCLALGQGTACVMHLMRVMEVGLKALAVPLGIPYAPSWEGYLLQISNNMAVPHKKKPRSWKVLEPFFRDISGDLVTIKSAFRNPTMHVGRKYSREEAEEVFRAVKRFMVRLAEGLPPPKARKKKAKI